MIRYLSKDEILVVNFNTYKSHGGFYTPPHNIKHEGNLDYVLEVWLKPYATSRSSLCDFIKRLRCVTLSHFLSLLLSCFPAPFYNLSALPL